MQAFFVQVTVLLGLHVQLCATAASSARVSKAARAAVSSEGSMELEVIPDHLLETMNSDFTTPILELADHAPAPVPLGVPLPQVREHTIGNGLQNGQFCHPLKLPAEVQLVAQEQTWRSLTGAWYGRDDVRLASWQRNHFRNDRLTMFINSDVERALALEEGSPKTDAEMISEFDWTAADEPILGSPEPALNIPILDCNRHLALVVRMREEAFHAIEIYDPSGYLLAETLIDFGVERIQFVDPSGFLIATAEAPAINSSLTRSALSAVADPTRGYVLPYEIHFEAGGYTNASQLLSTDYRWAVAVAVQSRAALLAPVMAAAAGAHPGELTMPRWYIALQVLGVFVGTGFVFAIFFGMYRLVYPAAPRLLNQPHGYFRKPPAQTPAVKKFASFVERPPIPAAVLTGSSSPTAYIIRD